MSACGPKANSIRKNAEMHPPTFAVRRFHQPEISTEANLGLDVANVRIVVSLPLKENAPNLVEAMNHVSPLLRPRLWIPSRRRTPGFHRSLCVPQTRQREQVDLGDERSPICRRESTRSHHSRALRARGALRIQDRHER